MFNKTSSTSDLDPNTAAKHEQIEGSIPRLAQIFKVLGSECRFRIMRQLLQEGEQKVSELRISNPHVSQALLSSHLGLLRREHLVTSKSVGKHKHYSVADETVSKIINVFIELYDSHPNMINSHESSQNIPTVSKKTFKPTQAKKQILNSKNMQSIYEHLAAQEGCVAHFSSEQAKDMLYFFSIYMEGETIRDIQKRLQNGEGTVEIAGSLSEILRDDTAMVGLIFDAVFLEVPTEHRESWIIKWDKENFEKFILNELSGGKTILQIVRSIIDNNLILKRRLEIENPYWKKPKQLKKKRE